MNYSVRDPATLEIIDQVEEMTSDTLDRAIDFASASLRSWRKDPAVRAQILHECASTLRAHELELAELLTREQGKVLSLAKTEVQMSAGLFEWYADYVHEVPWVENLADRSSRKIRIENRPVGVVAAITPWNYPLTLLAVKLAPALLAGNTVLVKPARTTPLATRRMLELFADYLPPGVVQLVTGSVAGRRLSAHPAIAKIAFTGSTSVGQELLRQSAERMVRVTLELGGNDPAIVLDDAEPSIAASKIISSAFRNAGQTCMSIKRVYVPEHRYDEWVDGLADAASKLVVGHGLDNGVAMGPLHNASQLQNVQSLVADSLNRGGRIAYGGSRGCDLPGYFHQPTVVAELKDDAPLVSQEQFGSALPVVAYRGIDELVGRLNADPFGLGASVWTRDSEHGSQLASEIDTGLVWVNSHNVLELDAPFGGRRMSGIGSERGRWGLQAFLEPTTVSITELS